jgi:excisionase family DNA binding protein
MEAHTQPREWMTADDVGRRLGVTAQTVRALARDNRLPKVKVGSRLRFDRQAIEQWIANGGSGGAA